MGLHFDLTVPFARYVLENAGGLEFPLRPYQIEKVWRGERPQQGRYREFTQADIDIVATDELPAHYDAEVPQVIAEALSGLPVPQLPLQVNNRKVMEGFFRGLGIAEADRGHADRRQARQGAGRQDRLSSCRPMPASPSSRRHSAWRLPRYARRTSLSSRPYARSVSTYLLLDEGLEELRQVVVGAAGAEGVDIVADLRIARGLADDTGTVFETRHGRLRAPRVDLFGRPIRPARQVTAGTPIPASASRSASPVCSCRSSPTASPLIARCPARSSWRSSTRSPVRRASRSPPSLRACGIPTEVAVERAEVRQADSLRRTPGIPFVSVPRQRRRAAQDQGHPRRRPG